MHWQAVDWYAGVTSWHSMDVNNKHEDTCVLCHLLLVRPDTPRLTDGTALCVSRSAGLRLGGFWHNHDTDTMTQVKVLACCARGVLPGSALEGPDTKAFHCTLKSLGW